MANRTGWSYRLANSVALILGLIGRPFFWLLLFAINILLFLFYAIGRIVLLSLRELGRLPRLLGSFVSWGFEALIAVVHVVLVRLKKKLAQAFQKPHPRGRPPKPRLTRPQPRLTWPKRVAFIFPKLKFPRVELPRLTIPAFKLPRLRKRPRPPVISLRRLSPVVSLFLLLSLVFTFAIYLPFLASLPRPSMLKTRQQSLTTKILARDGTVLFKIYKDQNRTLIPLKDIPPIVIQATLSIEDQDFYSHGGFSYRGILRAIERNVFDHQTQGGSTITQQLVKNALLSPEKTVIRKIKEIMLAVLVELTFTKDEILEMYFNEVAYGGTAYGIEEAAQMYFGISVRDVSLSQAALLAGLSAAPTTYSPFGANPERAKTRQVEVLRRMVEEGFISADEATKAREAPLEFIPQTQSIIAPHFVMYVKDLLVQRYGEQRVLQGGLEVTTTLDPTIQAAAEAAVSSEVGRLTRLNVRNGAAVVTRPKTGEILAMVGSKDYFDVDNDGQVNVTTRARQPGSSIKPVNYAVALSRGFTPATVLVDSPICYRLPNQKPYCPRNYDNRFHGNITLRQALASSYNVPAVKTLASYGVDLMVEQGKRMGITTWDDPSRFGLSLTLGGGEVKMVDMAVVYGTLANMGLKVDLQPILKVTDSKGKVLEAFECQGSFSDLVSQGAQAATQTTCSAERAVDGRIAYQLTNILSDNSARAPAFGTHSVLTVPSHQVAVKTGTTQNLRDNWTIGYTSDFVIVTWVGNNDNTPMSYVASGITGASPIWRTITDALLLNQPQHVFALPEGLTKVTICTLTGELACEGCPSREELFTVGTEPKRHCSPEKIKELIEKKAQEERDRLLQGGATSN